MKFAKSIIVVLAIILNINTRAQENTSLNEYQNKPLKNVHEISYSLKAALGYSFLRAFNNGFNLGVGANVGIGLRVDKFDNNIESIAEIVNIIFFSRNLFLKNKSLNHFFYDVGVFSSFSYDEAAIYDLGISLSFFYGFKKLKVGQVFQFSYNIHDYHPSGKFPHFSFKPLIIRYKF